MPESDACVVGREACGCITLADSRPDDMTAADRKHLGDFVARGGDVIRTTVGEARAMPHFLPMECPHDPKGWAPALPEPKQKVKWSRSSRGWNARVAFESEMTDEGYKNGGERSLGGVVSEGRGQWFATMRDPNSYEDIPGKLGPFKNRDAAGAEMLARWQAWWTDQPWKPWVLSERKPGPVPTTWGQSGRPVPPFKPGQIWASGGGDTYRILAEPEYSDTWGKRSKSVHVLALHVDPPPTGWGRKGTYLDCSMFDHLVLVEDVPAITDAQEDRDAG